MHFITSRLTCAVFMGFTIRTGLARAEPPTHFPTRGIQQQAGDKEKYFQYVSVPRKGAYSFGFNRGNSEHSISRHEQSRGGSFRSKVKWNDNKGSSGEQYWEYNHDDKGDDAYPSNGGQHWASIPKGMAGWNKGQSYPGYGGMQWAQMPKGMDGYRLKGYHPSSSGSKTTEEEPTWMKDFVNSGSNNWEGTKSMKPLEMYGHVLGGNLDNVMHGGVTNYGSNYASSAVDATPGFSYQPEDLYQHPGPSYKTASLPYPGESPAGTQVQGEMYQQITGTFPSSEESLQESHFRDDASGYRHPTFDNPMMSYGVGDQGVGHQYGVEMERGKENLSLEEAQYGNSGQPKSLPRTGGNLGAGSMTEAIFTQAQNIQNSSSSNEKQKVDDEVSHVAGDSNETKTARPVSRSSRYYR